MTILGYSLDEAGKFAVAIAGFVIAAVAMFVFVDPGFQAGVEVLIYALIGAIGVFAIPNPNPDDVYKALSALAGSLIAVAEFFTKVPSETGTKVAALIYAFAFAYVIFRTKNARSVVVRNN